MWCETVNLPSSTSEYVTSGKLYHNTVHLDIFDTYLIVLFPVFSECKIKIVHIYLLVHIF